MNHLKRLFSRHYYRYLWFRIRETNLKDYLFFDLWTMFIVLTVFLLNLILFYPGKIRIYFPSLTIQEGVVENLLRSTSIFLGIVFSFVLLSFNVSNKYFGRSSFNGFFANKKIKILFTLFVCSISFMVYTLSYLKQIKSANNYSTVLFSVCILFSVTIVFSIFPIAIALLKESQSRRNISSLIKRTEWSSSRIFTTPTAEEIANNAQQEPKLLVTEIGTVAIKEMDMTTLVVILNSFEELFESVKQESDQDQQKTRFKFQKLKNIYFDYTEVIRNLFQAAIKERNEPATLKLVMRRLEIEKKILPIPEEIGITDHLGKYQGWDFSNDLQAFFQRSLQLNEDSVTAEVVDVYRDFIGVVIKDVLSARKFQYDPEQWEQTFSETSMLTSFLSEVKDFNLEICKSKKSHLFKHISNLYSTVTLTVIDSNVSSESIKWLLALLDSYKIECLDSFIEYCDPKRLEFLEFPFTNGSMVLRKFESDIIVTGLIRATENLYVSQKLNYMVMSQNSVLIAYLIANIPKNKKYETYLKLFIALFSNLKSKVKEDDTDYKKDLYLILESTWRRIEKELKKKKLDELSTKLSQVLGEFIFKTKFEVDLRTSGYVADRRVV